MGNTTGMAVAAGQRWRCGPIVVKVLAVADGWVMYRSRRCHPSCLWWRDFETKFTPPEPPIGSLGEDNYALAG